MPTRILVVEDSATQAMALCTVLEEQNFAVTRVSRGEHALAHLEHGTVDLVLSDIVMPGMSGYDLCREIKSDPRLAHLPVVLLTSLSDPLDIVRGLECGADNYVTKPYDPEYLCARIRHVLDRQRLRARPKASLGVNVSFLGTSFSITSDKEQILDLFISTVEDVVRANHALQESQRELAAAQARLEEHARGMTREAQRSRERYAALMHQASDAIAVLDPAGRILEANARASELLGHPLEALTSRTLAELATPECASDLSRDIASLGTTGRVTSEIDFVHASGRTVTCRFAASRTASDDGDLVLAILHDVTERRELEEQLHQAQKMEAVGQLAGGIAHDFNNLLTVITSYSGILLLDLPPDHALRADINEIQGAATRAAALTRQLLAFSRRQVLQAQLVDVNALVVQLEKMLSRLVREDIRMNTSLCRTAGTVWADPGQLEQVVMNLVVNARDAMPDGGDLTIRTFSGRLPEGLTPSEEMRAADNRCVVIEVSDTGTGIPPAVQARIFEPFFTTKEPGKGTGLGLSTVYGIVRQSGGDLEVESTVGAGTTFRIYLPARDAAADEPAARVTAEAPARAGGETVLLAEDDTALRAVASRILRRSGYQVLEAHNGRHALEICAGHAGPVHLLLTDMVMPEMSGYELGEQVAASHPAMRILFMSGYSHELLARQGVTRNGSAYIEKPFTGEALAAKVREVLDAPVTHLRA